MTPIPLGILAAPDAPDYYFYVSNLETCTCGNTLQNASLYARGVYQRRDRVLLSLGATRRPIKVEIRCVRCEHVFTVTDDYSVRDRACARDWLTDADLAACQAKTAA